MILWTVSPSAHESERRIDPGHRATRAGVRRYVAVGLSNLLCTPALYGSTPAEGIALVGVLWALSKWPFTSRLETRTKESTIPASVWVSKTRTRNESKNRWGLVPYQLKWEPPRKGAPLPDQEPLGVTGLRWSEYVGTRKMVNYS